MEKDKLIALVRENSMEAKKALFEEFYRRTYATAFYITRDRNAAEDLTQDAFIKAFNRLESLKNPEKFGSWLASITANLARDYLEKQRRLVSTADFSHLAEKNNPGGEGGTEDIVIGREEREAIRSHISRLPVEQREVVVLRYYHDLSMEEISTSLGVSVGTVKSRLHRAKKKLAHFMEPPDSFSRHIIKEGDQTLGEGGDGP